MKDTNYNKRNNFDYALITEDTLALMSDDQLKRLFIDIRSNINKNRRNKIITKEREKDLCYIQREMQYRNEIITHKKENKN